MTKTPTTIETDRLILRDPREADADAITRYIGNFNVSKTLSRVPYPYAREDALWWLGERARLAGSAQDFAFAITQKEGPDEVIGVIGVHPLREDTPGEEAAALPGAAEMGYWLGEPFWGQRIVSEAARAVVAHVFATTPLQTLVAGYFTGNEASRRILTGLGFEPCGVEERFSVALDRNVECPQLRLDRASYLARLG